MFVRYLLFSDVTQSKGNKWFIKGASYEVLNEGAIPRCSRSPYYKAWWTYLHRMKVKIYFYKRSFCALIFSFVNKIHRHTQWKWENNQRSRKFADASLDCDTKAKIQQKLLLIRNFHLACASKCFQLRKLKLIERRSKSVVLQTLSFFQYIHYPTTCCLLSICSLRSPLPPPIT